MPIHIGTGEELSSTFFYQEKNKYFIFQEDTLISIIQEYGYFSQFLEFLETSAVESRRDNKENMSLNNFISKLVDPKPQGNSAFAKLLSSPKVSQNSVDNLKNALKNPDNALYILEGSARGSGAIQKCIKGIHGPYIVGSEIKGAIRTALFSSRIKDTEISNLQNKIKYELFKGNSKKYFGDRETFGEKALFGRVSEDIFRELNFRDSDPLDISSLKIKCVSPLVDNKPRNDKKPPKVMQYNNIECIGKNNEFSTHLSFNHVNKSNFTVEEIKTACYEFTKKILENLKIKVKQKENEVNHYLQQITFLESQNSLDTPVLSIGRFTGFFSKTIGIKLSDEIIKDLGIKLYPNGKAKAGKDFPTSIWVTGEKELMGFCQLTFIEK